MSRSFFLDRSDRFFHRGGRICVLLISIASVLACGETKPLAPKTARALEGTEWVATSIEGRPLIARSNVTLNFIGGGLGGYSGCN